MTVPISLPVAPAQPDLDSYGLDELALFKTYTRASYRAAFGIEAPPYDPARLIKSWFDSSADTSDIAATVNLPGAVEYPKYAIAPTNARYGQTNNGPDAILLSLKADALGLLNELGIPNLDLTDEGARLQFYPVDYHGDARRMWSFQYQGESYNVGSLLATRHAHGVGWPGHWEVATDIRWVADAPAPTGLDDRRPPLPVPVRELLPNERIEVGLFGGPRIVRTDRPQAGPAGQFTEADRALLRQILALLQSPV